MRLTINDIRLLRYIYERGIVTSEELMREFHLTGIHLSTKMNRLLNNNYVMLLREFEARNRSIHKYYVTVYTSIILDKWDKVSK